MQGRTGLNKVHPRSTMRNKNQVKSNQRQQLFIVALIKLLDV